VERFFEHDNEQVEFEVLTAVSTKMAVFWVVAPCDDRPGDGDSKDLWNVGKLLLDYTAQRTAIFMIMNLQFRQV
jgi:hypothetical protein